MREGWRKEHGLRGGMMGRGHGLRRGRKWEE